MIIIIMDSILDRLDKMNLKGYGQLLPPEVEVLKTMSLRKIRTKKVMTNPILIVEIG